MNVLAAFPNRVAQTAMYLAMFFIRIPLPNTKVGEGCSLTLVDELKTLGLKHPMLLVESALRDLGISKPLEDALEKEGIPYALFTDIVPNPTVRLVESCKHRYQSESCDCLIALGGGSTMDLAKAAGILLSYPGKRINQFEGILKVHRKIPALFAIPTTAGTGSEATLAAVIVDEATHHKYQIDAPQLVPSYAYLDGSYMAKLPKKVIAMTGMDALTHALEAYIGRSNTKFTRQKSIAAFDAISKHLYAFYEHPEVEEHRNKMLQASFDAGCAFTRAYVGYVHALAHALGGFYNVPHGYANAILLPYVLRAYGKAIEKKAKQILGYLGVSSYEGPAYEALAAYVDDLNGQMGIPRQFDLKISEEDFKALARHASKEGNPLYPVPKMMNAKELEAILRRAVA